MSPPDPSPSVDPTVEQSIRERLKLVVLGCTSDCHDKLDPILAKHDVSIWTLNEYLLLHPLPAYATEEERGNALTFQPFIERQLDALRFVPALPSDLGSAVGRSGALRLTPNERAVKRQYLSLDLAARYTMRKTHVGKDLLSKWIINNKEPEHYKKCVSCNDAKLIDADDVIEYNLGDYFWAGGGGTDNENVPACDVLGVPISSECRIYGYLVMQCRPNTLWRAEEEPPGTPLSNELITPLLEAVRKAYVPMLALCHHSMAERSLVKWLDAGNGEPLTKDSIASKLKDIRKEFIPEIKPSTGIAPENSEPKHPGMKAALEDILDWLWKVRLHWVETRDKWKDGEIQELKRNLIFSNFGVASPSMLEVVESAARLGFRFNKKLPTSLSSALVIGGAGAGKDKLTRMVSLLSDGYTFGTIYTFNMAAIRPQGLMGPVLQGVETTSLTDSGAPKLGIKSVLAACAHVPGSGAEPKTVILDELNSMDIDQQGVLLRILENAELTPLFSSGSTSLNFLCIGVMNEEPEELMKEDELQNIMTQNPLLGRILGTVFSELFRRSRRLRPDLYYRMARPGVLKIPSLAGRRNDIPLLFYSFLEDNPEGHKYNVELGAYRALMDKTLPWKGNIRELQKVARAIARVATESEPDRDGRFNIDRSMVQKVLESTRAETSRQVASA
jgi:transcriptional regulator with AAA-type ATPase domain